MTNLKARQTTTLRKDLENNQHEQAGTGYTGIGWTGIGAGNHTGTATCTDTGTAI